jgi:predicted Zn-dependent peptidase
MHLLSLLLLATPVSPSSVTSPLPSQGSVAHEKYTLANGLTVILHEDRSLPQACVNLWYRVGSKDERTGRSGFAHLFEHLMFMGTERVPEGRFDQIMETAGGWNNASTSQDRTNYYDSGPSEILPTLLWLEADRLEALGENITQAKLDTQRDVVRNERRQTSENRPYGKSELKLSELLYPVQHPYQHSVIGSHEDLEAATVKDVREFFATYYVPSNGSLVVAGDFDSEQIRPLIAELFGSLPRGNDVEHARPEEGRGLEVAVSGVHTMTDRVQFARSTLAWHSPPVFEPGDAELELRLLPPAGHRSRNAVWPHSQPHPQ